MLCLIFFVRGFCDVSSKMSPTFLAVATTRCACLIIGDTAGTAAHKYRHDVASSVANAQAMRQKTRARREVVRASTLLFGPDI